MDLFRLIALIAALAAAGPAAGGMNPGLPGFPRVDLFGTTYDNNHYSSICVKCHQRNPSGTTPDAAGGGSHFVYGGTGLGTGNTGWEKLDAWNGTGGLSRYGRTGDNVSVTGTAGELICESCHSLRRNTGRGKIVVQDNGTTDPSALCEGCHGETSGVHHAMTGDTVSLYGRALSTSDSLFVRSVPLVNSEVTYPGANALNCRSCHKPHDAQTQTGARILKRGQEEGGGAVQGAGATGIERQADIDNTGASHLVTDFSALCNSCHRADN